MANGDNVDQSVTVGDNAEISGSAIGAGSSITSSAKRSFTFGAIAAGVIAAIVASILTGWWDKMIHWLSQLTASR